MVVDLSGRSAARRGRQFEAGGGKGSGKRALFNLISLALCSSSGWSRLDNKAKAPTLLGAEGNLEESGGISGVGVPPDSRREELAQKKNRNKV